MYAWQHVYASPSLRPFPLLPAEETPLILPPSCILVAKNFSTAFSFFFSSGGFASAKSQSPPQATPVALTTVASWQKGACVCTS